MPQSGHTFKQFDADLEALCTRVLQMGGLVESQIQAAIDVYSTGDIDLAARVIDGDRRVNALEVQIDGLCAALIARRQPAANDLRVIMAVGKAVTDLERIGDESEKIARLAERVHDFRPADLQHHSDVRRMAQRARAMLRRALDALARQDPGQAEQVLKEDAGIDDEFRSLFKRLMKFSADNPNDNAGAIDVIWIAKAIERIGDHVKNVAESVIYLARGTDVRHARFKASGWNTERASSG